VDLMVLKPNPWDLSSFSALTLLFVWFDPWNRPRYDLCVWWDVEPRSINCYWYWQTVFTSILNVPGNDSTKYSSRTKLYLHSPDSSSVAFVSGEIPLTSNSPVPFLDPTQHRTTNNEALHISSEVTCNLYTYWTRRVPCQSDLHWSWTVKAGET